VTTLPHVNHVPEIAPPIRRDAELARLGAAIEAASRGRGSLVLLEGEAGIG
jgi:predicted ATPase